MRLTDPLSPSPAGGAPGPSRLLGVLARAPYLSGLLMAAGMLGVTLLVAAATRLPVRDPDAVVAYRSRVFIIGVGLVLFLVLDVVVRGAARAGWRRGGMRTEIAAVWRRRWTRKRMLVALSAILSFYITYFAYRNLKSFLPVLREATFDAVLLDLDRALLGGNDPAALLHGILGKGFASQVLSSVYLIYLTFVPLSVVAAVAWTRRVAAGLWYVTAVNFNWVLGLLSYYLVPSLGPVFVDPPLADQMPATAVWDLQQILLVDRVRFVADPIGSGAIQSIAGFASLHTSVLFTAALMAHMLGARRALRIGLWALLSLTVVATIYFGWHYLIDDVAGLIIGGASVYLAGIATGWRGLPGRRPRANSPPALGASPPEPAASAGGGPRP
jgi:membrane-associated phospholipid phosphatase